MMEYRLLLNSLLVAKLTAAQARTVSAKGSSALKLLVTLAGTLSGILKSNTWLLTRAL